MSSSPRNEDPRITRDMLVSRNACGTYLRRFDAFFPKERFPHGVTVTKAKCVRLADEFDWFWAAQNFLSFKNWRLFDAADTTAILARDKAYSEARDAYWKVCDNTLKCTVIGGARRARAKASLKAEREYNKAVAAAFATAFIKEHTP